VSARCPSIALREYPEIDIVVAGKTPDQGDLFIVSLKLPVDRGRFPVIPGDHCVLASPAAALLLQPDLGESNLQRRFVLTDALKLIQPLGSVCRFGRLLLVSP
jgi:hypothetical protein